MAALRAGVRRGAGMRRVPPWLAVLLVTGYRVSIVSLMGLLTKETCLALSARCRLWLMRPRLLRMGSTATTRLLMAATITVYIPMLAPMSRKTASGYLSMVSITAVTISFSQTPDL